MANQRHTRPGACMLVKVNGATRLHSQHDPQNGLANRDLIRLMAFSTGLGFDERYSRFHTSTLLYMPCAITHVLATTIRYTRFARRILGNSVRLIFKAMLLAYVSRDLPVGGLQIAVLALTSAKPSKMRFGIVLL